jgi:AmmeMemoRadiSam system protein B
MYYEDEQGNGARSPPVPVPDTHPIHASISNLDKAGMDAITQGLAPFHEYLKKTANTICGRHPIGVILGAIEAHQPQTKFTFIKYAQSSQVYRLQDSSVSYAAAISLS